MNTLHIEGSEKLKRFGFPIHGCIDGFSRKLVCLVVSMPSSQCCSHY